MQSAMIIKIQSSLYRFTSRTFFCYEKLNQKVKYLPGRSELDTWRDAWGFWTFWIAIWTDPGKCAYWNLLKSTEVGSASAKTLAAQQNFPSLSSSHASLHVLEGIWGGCAMTRRGSSVEQAETLELVDLLSWIPPSVIHWLPQFLTVPMQF